MVGWGGRLSSLQWMLSGILPFLLIRYRDNGYLDASRHGRRELRVFSPDCCREPHALDEPAWAVSGKEPDVQLAGSYQRLDSNVIILKVKKATLTVAFLTEWGGVTHTPAPLLSCRGSRCNCAPKCAPRAAGLRAGRQPERRAFLPGCWWYA